jgi:hypothetical protein
VIDTDSDADVDVDAGVDANVDTDVNMSKLWLSIAAAISIPLSTFILFSLKTVLILPILLFCGPSVTNDSDGEDFTRGERLLSSA